MYKSTDENISNERHQDLPVISTGTVSSSGLRRMALNDTKAGMEGLDVQKINQIIDEASKGSKFYIHQQNQQDKLNFRIQRVHESFSNLSEEQILSSTQMMDRMAKKMKFDRVLDRTIVHVDMDAYYAALEMRDDPTLSNVPMAVGGDSMLSTSNYLAQKFGVRAGIVGIACNCLLAKICADINKPNGQYYLPPTIEAIKEFVVKLPIRKVSGIGNVTEQLLNSLNVFTCRDLWEHRGVINLLFKPATVSFLLAVSLGIGNSWFNVSSETVDQNRKSISLERTFSGSNTNIEPKLCHSLCTDLERELISKELKAHTVTLKIKTMDFQVKTRAVRLLSATNEADIIFETAWSIHKSYANEMKDLAIRLLGVRLSNFQSSCEEAVDNVANALPSSKQKKQGRIDHLLLKLKTNVLSESETNNIPKFECPICCTKFFLYNGLEAQVEKCLTNEPVETSESAKNASKATSVNCESAAVLGDLSKNSSKNKRKSPNNNSNHSNKKRTKLNHSVGHRKITDYTTSENSGVSFSTKRLQR